MRVTGVDPAASMIARGRSVCPDLDLHHVADPCHARIAERFDAVLLFDVVTMNAMRPARSSSSGCRTPGS